LNRLYGSAAAMSPAPDSTRRPGDFLSSRPSSLSHSPSLSISTILSRVPRPSPEGRDTPFTADRRASSYRRNFSGGPRPAPFQRQTVTLNEPGTSPEPANNAMSNRAAILSTLDAQRRRIEERRTNEWRAQSSLPRIYRNTPSGQWREVQPERPAPSDRPINPQGRSGQTIRRYVSSPRPFLSNESSESDSDSEEDPENKFSSGSMTNLRRTPPPTFLTPQSSPSSQSTPSTPKQNDDDPSRNAYTLSCRFCANLLTERGMRARLVADARVHIWSTDHKPK
jgi:FAM72 protein